MKNHHRRRRKPIKNTQQVSALRGVTLDQNILPQARMLHRAGRLAEAESLYRQILQADPSHYEALHSLGMLANQVGQHEAAVEIIRRAIALKPDYIEAYYNLGILLYSLGRLEEAETSFRRVLALKTDFAGAHNNLGFVLQARGRLQEAADSYSRALSLQSNYAEAHNNLGNVLHALGKPAEAEASYRRALSLTPEYVEAHTNLGIELQSQGRLDEAAESYRRALALRPDHVDALNNLGKIFKDQGRLEDAIASYRKALAQRPDFAEVYNNLGEAFHAQGRFNDSYGSFLQALKWKPDYAEAYSNIGLTLVKLGRLDEAVKSMQIAVENALEDRRFSDRLIFLLNHYMPNIEIDSQYIKAQKIIQQISSEFTNFGNSDDNGVRELYHKCINVLDEKNLHFKTEMTQLYRGQVGTFNCDRHMLVFNVLNIIPEYCFNCFKVTIQPRTVVELFNLLFVFNKLKLKNDNPRKCMVEIRPNMSGSYKGFIYCGDLNEGKEILNIVKSMVDQDIGKGIPMVVKRGCSEFQVAYPDYNKITDNKMQMAYNEEWRQHEDYADKQMNMQPAENMATFTNNHSGLTLLDFLVMRNWLAYAAKIGDASYQKLAKLDMDPVCFLTFVVSGFLASFYSLRSYILESNLYVIFESLVDNQELLSVLFFS